MMFILRIAFVCCISLSFLDREWQMHYFVLKTLNILSDQYSVFSVVSVRNNSQG